MLKSKIIEYRRHIHKDPELGFETYQTAAYVFGELTKLGYNPVYALNKAAVLARLDNHKEKTIAFRSDLDGLKIKENANLHFASTNGCMHACGHDAHIAMLLGAAYLLKEHQKELPVNVLLIFQPAEEGPLPGGAKKLMEEYNMYDVNYFFAFHVTNKLTSGEVGIKSHEACAAPDLWEAHFKGVGCHGATPKLGKNPILPASEAILAFQKLYEELNDPLKVISTTYTSSGVSMNIILEDAYIKGTARSFKNEDREFLNKQMKQIVQTISLKYQVEGNFTFHYAYDPVYNDDEPVQIAIKAIQKTGAKYIKLTTPEMVGEDFSYYRGIAPTCLCWFGVRGAHQDFTDLHSDCFTLDENILYKGSQIYLEIAKNVNILE